MKKISVTKKNHYVDGIKYEFNQILLLLFVQKNILGIINFLCDVHIQKHKRS